MKIAIDIREAQQEKTGKGWYTWNLVSHLLQIDKKNEYLLYTDTAQSPFPPAKNVQIKIIDAQSFQWHWQTLKDLKQEKPDLFFAPTSYIIPALAPKSLRTIITVHDLVAFMFPSTHAAKAVVIERLTLRMALKKARHVLVVSDNTKQDLRKRFDYPEKKITETPCAASELFFKPAPPPQELEKFRTEMNLPEKFLLSVGTLEPRKNFPVLIKSFVNFKKWHPEFKLVIVGKKGWKYGKIEETLKEYNIEKEVIFPGYLKNEDLKKMYHLAQTFIFPSLYEGFGIPPLEAMACGCPVVSSSAASMPEVVGEAGILVDPKNAYKMADAVSSLTDNEDVRTMLRERGYQQAKKFSWQESAKKTLEIFTENTP